jgi:hypothetical protein
MAAITLEQARAAKAEAQDIFSRLGEVVGVGITKIGDNYALKVNLRRPLPGKSAAPKEVRGVPVKLELIGDIRRRA